ncbi:MAG: hypothetical protein K8U03_06245 [Planctomycetia bacterium]|nr:hypothetical protein [Planctomycetia bacterium]
MKTERRHELEKNQLADWLGHSLQWCEENARLLAGSVVGVLIVAVVFLVLSNRKEERAASAWNSFFSATASDNTTGLETLAKADSDLLAGQMADMVLADIALNEGIDLLSSDREAGEKRLAEAKKFYTDLKGYKSDDRLQERAALGLARYYESMGLIDDAKAQYTTLKDWKGGLYHDVAAQKLAYLEKPATLAFAKWYRDQKPKPKPSGTALFDPHNLSTLPNTEASFPPATTSGATPTGTPAATPTATAATTAAVATPSATPALSPSASPTVTPTATPSATPPK